MMGTAQDGAIVFDLLAAGVLTLVIGAGALILLQRAIKRNMMVTGVFQRPAEPERPRRASIATLSLAVDEGAAVPGIADSILRRIMLAHVAAGAVYGNLATIILFRFSDIEFLPLRTFVVFWAYAWPTTMVLHLLLGPDRRAKALIHLFYFAVLILLGIGNWLLGSETMVLGGLPLPAVFQPLLLWVLYALPSLFLLLFLNRTIRTIGPLVLVFVFILMVGGHIAVQLLSLPSVAYVAVTVAIAIGLGGLAAFWGTALLGVLVAAWPAWLAVAFLRDRYAAKRMSEFQLTVNAIWMLQALMLSLSLFREHSVLAMSAALVPLIAWRLTLTLALQPTFKAARERPPQTLLLLRVYGFGRRSRRLFDLLGARWRLLGSIDLIAAPDLASRTVEPATFLDFIRGRLVRLFVRTPDNLRERLDAIDRKPDPGARFRVNQLFCSDDMWKEAVIALMGAATLVVMDLRGFSMRRAGCVFEVQTLLDTVPLSRRDFLFDRSTDRSALDTILAERWRELDSASPNLAAAAPSVRLLDAGAGDIKAVKRLLAIAQSPLSH